MRLLCMPYYHNHLFPSHKGFEPSVEGFITLLDDWDSGGPDHVLGPREELFEQLVLRA